MRKSVLVATGHLGFKNQCLPFSINHRTLTLWSLASQFCRCLRISLFPSFFSQLSIVPWLWLTWALFLHFYVSYTWSWAVWFFLSTACPHFSCRGTVTLLPPISGQLCFQAILQDMFCSALHSLQKGSILCLPALPHIHVLLRAPNSGSPTAPDSLLALIEPDLTHST